MQPVKIKLAERSDLRVYGTLSLPDLAQRIITVSNPQALREFHEHRTPFRHNNERRLRLAEYLDALRDSPLALVWAGHRALAVDRAYDLTLDKFSNLPPDGQAKGGGPDCRLYFRAFLRHLARDDYRLTKRTQLEQERLAASVLQGLVARHFYLSCLECARNSKELVKRVFWRVNECTLCVFMPAGMSGSQCRAWLAANVPEFERARRNGSQRVQTLINERLLLPRMFSWSKFDAEGVGLPSTGAGDGNPCDSLSKSGLAHTIAAEKAENIAGQRPAIRRLGRLPLKGLILRIFEDLAGGGYNVSTTAASFGLSKATLSRFAGTKWSAPTDRGRGSRIPDLWRNMAQTLAGHADFIATTKDAGVWRQVQSVLAPSTGSTEV